MLAAAISTVRGAIIKYLSMAHASGIRHPVGFTADRDVKIL